MKKVSNDCPALNAVPYLRHDRAGLEVGMPRAHEKEGDLSPWLYPPVSGIAWALISLAFHTFIIRAQRRNPALCYEHEKAIREARLAATGELRRTLRIREATAAHQDKLAALTVGFAITIAIWRAIFAFGFDQWLSLSAGMPPWIYSVVSIVVWFVSAHRMYRNLRRGKRRHSAAPDAR